MLKQLTYRQVEEIVLWVWPELAGTYPHGFGQFATIVLDYCALALEDLSSPQGRPVYAAQLLKAIETYMLDEALEHAYYWSIGFLSDLQDIYAMELQDIQDEVA